MSNLFCLNSDEYNMSEEHAGAKSFSVITDFDIPFDFSIRPEEVNNPVPILPLRNMVLFPKVIAPIIVGRDSSMRLVREAERKGKLIGAFCQCLAEEEDPGFEDLYTCGVAARVVRIIDLPDGSTTVLLKGLDRVQLKGITSTRPYLLGEIELDPEVSGTEEKMEGDVMLGTLRETVTRYFRAIDVPQELAFAIRNLNDSEIAINYTCTNISFRKKFKDELLRCPSIESRFFTLIKMLNREIHYHELKQSIQMRTREDIDKQQREYFLQQQLKTIQDELGGGQQSVVISDLRQRGHQKPWSPEMLRYFLEEVMKLERMNPQIGDYSMQLTYLNTLLSLPWEHYTRDNHNLDNAERVLNKDHYGLDKVKERILEQLAVLKLKNDMKSPILCLYGPPGVGKTSLGRSIAKALKREYVRVSLGGVHDESEIRGHRRTYIGAMPGRIIKGIAKVKSSNPVFILDEIDKVGVSHNGDPSAALLEVLDPEQNMAFHDNYLDVDYDLSKVMFIATANNLATIPTPLLDRMELIEVSGYVTEEKIEIARRHLIPKELKANGIDKKRVKISDKAIEQIIEHYTRESGVRELEKKLSKVMRKIAVRMAREEEIKRVDVTPENLTEFLGVKEFSRDKYQGNDYAGVVTGLAWTAVGGEILFVETSLSHGKGNQLTLTGNLGDVMKESAMLALEYIKAHTTLLQIDEEVFDHWHIHVHVPEGAIPKDGPSAGITMATSLASALTQRKVKAGIAMTGEITLRGKVLPVGGIKEKILAAKRAGISEIILCQENRKDIEEIKQDYIKGMTFHYVSDVKEVFNLALTDELVDNPIDFTIKKKEEEKA